MLSDIFLLGLNCNLLIHSYSFIDLEAIFCHVRLPTPIYAYAIHRILIRGHFIFVGRMKQNDNQTSKTCVTQNVS